MNFVVLALLLLVAIKANYAKESRRVARDSGNEDETTTTIVQTTLNYDTEDLEQLLKNKDAESAAILISKISKQASSQLRSPLSVQESSKSGTDKAYACSKINCPAEDKVSPVCACNFVTGNVASFKNKCDSQKHNCRFDTNFKVILDDICPWEFAFRRRNMEYDFDYADPKYYN